jgi:hypothetical protein
LLNLISRCIAFLPDANVPRDVVFQNVFTLGKRFADTYDGLIESRRRDVEENVIGHAFLAVEARRLSLLRHEVLTTGPESRRPDRCCFP